MTTSAARVGAVLALGLLVTSCSPTAVAPTASPPPGPTVPSTSVSTPASASPAVTTASTSPTGTATPAAPGNPGTVPTGGSARPGLGGVPDPATLKIPSTPRTTPNLGDSRYLQPTATLSALPSSPVMGYEYAGVKALLIMQKFGLDRQPGEAYRKQELNSDVVAAVKRFQAAHGLSATGEVNRATWTAMFPDVPWTIEHWRTAPVLPVDAPAEARIEQMITFMRSQIGAPYLWGGAGEKPSGYDCSGLMLQAMYSAGLDPAPINVVDHQRPDYPTAKKLYNYSGFKHVPAT